MPHMFYNEIYVKIFERLINRMKNKSSYVSLSRCETVCTDMRPASFRVCMIFAIAGMKMCLSTSSMNLKNLE